MSGGVDTKKNGVFILLSNMAILDIYLKFQWDIPPFFVLARRIPLFIVDASSTDGASDTPLPLPSDFEKWMHQCTHARVTHTFEVF